MSKKSVRVIGIIIIIVVVIAVIFLVRQRSASQNSNSGSGDYKLSVFVRCLKNQKVTFYGAFWCAHCQNQKTIFGSAASALPYVECSTPDAQGQTAVCRQKNIAGYPTWEFKDGSQQEGEMTLAELAAKTGCAVPQ